MTRKGNLSFCGKSCAGFINECTLLLAALTQELH